MPELPEVETMVRGIRSFVEGQRILEFVRYPCRCRPLSITPKLSAIQRRCEGQNITAVRRRAKRLVLELASGDAFVIEPRMTGLVLVADPPDTEHLRYEWRLAGAKRQASLWFWDRRGLGTIRLLNPAQLAEILSDRFLGPDALEITIDDWRARLSRTSRPIKVALLDQKLVAGIGNLYASEILHLAGIHPAKPADRLGKRRIERLAAAVRKVLEMAIRHEGSTLSDGTYRNALNQSGAYQNAHRVYDREHETCLTCHGPAIARIVQAQRSTFFCRACQR
jgi:formamidopyrimidine-DNA glycosylase